MTSGPFDPLPGNLQPVAEEIDAGPLPLTGTVPERLRGTLVRNGPNPVVPDPRTHWFAGDGMLHAFYLREGQVHYRNRWVRTTRCEYARRYGRNPAGGSLHGGGEGERLVVDSGSANTNIIHHAGLALALEEAHPPMAVRLDSLVTLGTESFSSNLIDRFTAHPKKDPRTGELLFFAYGTPDFLTTGMSFGVISAEGRVTRFERFHAPYASMVHDFAITANHVMFPVTPLTASRERAQSGRPPFAWEPQYGTRIGIMPRSGSTQDIVWWRGPACYVFHIMNAWEDNDRLFADVIRFARPPLFPLPDGTPATSLEEPGRLVRWTFDLTNPGRGFLQTTLCDMPGEFPRIDERRTGLPYRHGWFAGNTYETGGMRDSSSVVHIDHASGDVDVFTFSAPDHVSEPVFAPRSKEEGDGWVLAVVWRGVTNTSDLVIFDALKVAAGPICVASLPVRVPDGFHGNWFAQTQIG